MPEGTKAEGTATEETAAPEEEAAEEAAPTEEARTEAGEKTALVDGFLARVEEALAAIPEADSLKGTPKEMEALNGMGQLLMDLYEECSEYPNDERVAAAGEELAQAIVRLQELMGLSAELLADAADGTEGKPYQAATEAELREAVTKGGYIQLTGDITLGARLDIRNSVDLDLAGHTLTLAENKVSNGKITTVVGLVCFGQLAIRDTAANGSIVSRSNAAIAAASGATLTLDGGTVSGSGCLVQLQTGAKFAMNGGKLQAANSNAVLLTSSGGEFVMTAGEIRSTSSAAAISVTGAKSSATLSGGTVTANGAGYAVSITGGGTLAMNDGTITAANTAVFGNNPNSAFTMAGGTINATTAVQAQVGAKFGMTGGTINATGTAVSGVWETDLSITGGSVSTTAIGPDYAVVSVNASKLTVGGTAQLAGDYAVGLLNYTNGATKSSQLVMNGGSVTATTQGVCGDNIKSPGCEAKIIDGSITADNGGTAIYWPMEGALNITGGTISGGTGIEAKSGTLSITGGSITGTGGAKDEDPRNGGSAPEGSAILLATQMYTPGLTATIRNVTLASAHGYGVRVYNTGKNQESASVTIGEGINITASLGKVAYIAKSGEKTVTNSGGAQTTVQGTTTLNVAANVASVSSVSGTDVEKTTYYANVADAFDKGVQKLLVFSDTAVDISRFTANTELTVVTGANLTFTRTSGENTLQVEETDGNRVYRLAGADAAASVGYFAYATLQSAVDAADGETVRLLKDVAEDITISSGKSITLDLNGKKLTNQSGHTITNQGTLTVTGSGTVDNVSHEKAALVNEGVATLNGGTFDRTMEKGYVTNSTSYVTAGGGNSYYTIVNAEGTMTINDGVVVRQAGGAKDAKYGYKGYHSSLIRNGDQDAQTAEMAIHGGEFYGGKTNVKNESDGALTIDGGSFPENLGYSVLNYGTASIGGGTFTSWNNTVIGNYGVTCSISDGSFLAVNKDGKATRATTDNAQNCHTTITGGMFGNQYIDYGSNFSADNPGYEIVRGDGWWNVALRTEDAAVAKIGDVRYYTLQAAANAVGTDGVTTIELLKDVWSDNPQFKKGTVVLDLGSHTIRGYIINNGASLTVNAQAGGGITYTSYAIGNLSGNVAVNGGSYVGGKYGAVYSKGGLTLNGGTFTGTTAGIMLAASGSSLTVDGGAAITADDDAILVAAGAKSTITINDGTVTGGKYSAIYDQAGSEIAIHGGTVQSNESIAINTKGGTVTLSGGSIKAPKDYGCYAQGGGTVIVQDGAIIADAAALAGNNTTGDMNFEIHGGTLTTADGPAVYMPGQGSLKMDGGTLNGSISLRMGRVEISGGTINASSNAGKISDGDIYKQSGNIGLADAVYVLGGAYTSGNAQYGNWLSLQITGGTIHAANGAAVAIYDLGKVAQTMNVEISDSAKLGTNAAKRHPVEMLTLKEAGVENPAAGYGSISNTVTGSIPEMPHVFWQKETTATCEASGLRTLACRVCGKEKREADAALGHSWMNGKCERKGCEAVCGHSFEKTDNGTEICKTCKVEQVMPKIETDEGTQKSVVVAPVSQNNSGSGKTEQQFSNTEIIQLLLGEAEEGKSVKSVTWTEESVEPEKVPLKAFEEIQNKIEAVNQANGNASLKISQVYLDINVYKQEQGLGDNSEVTMTKVTQTNSEMSFTRPIPAECIGKNCVYKIVRFHVKEDGTEEVTVLPATKNADNTLTFKTDRFSYYAIAYEEVAAPAATGGSSGGSGSSSSSSSRGADSEDTAPAAAPAAPAAVPAAAPAAVTATETARTEPVREAEASEAAVDTVTGSPEDDAKDEQLIVDENEKTPLAAGSEIQDAGSRGAFQILPAVLALLAVGLFGFVLFVKKRRKAK